MPAFVPGLKLSEAFYVEAVRLILDREFPGLAHSAARVGSGSEVLGFDTEMSTDHDWGPRLELFLRPEDVERVGEEIEAALRNSLPHTVLGYPTSFGEPDASDGGTQLLDPSCTGPVNHRVTVRSIRGWLQAFLGVDIQTPIATADWLSFPQQKLLGVTAGEVFHDDLGLADVRRQFAYYPHEVWLYLLAAGWARIGEEEHLMGRAGYVGDETGSALIGARLVRDVMHLGFLMERTYAPYAKWFGTAFGRLDCADHLTPHLQAALAATDWRDREEGLCQAFEQLAEVHNGLGLTEPLAAHATKFFGRPFRVIKADRFVEALRTAITDPDVKRITQKPLIGSIDQFSDSTAMLCSGELREGISQIHDS